MKKLFLLFITASLIFLSCEIEIPEIEEKPQDTIRILEVTPDTISDYTQPITFTVKMYYELLSQEQGIIKIYFNNTTNDPEGLLDTHVDKSVTKGTGECTLNVTVTPKNWSAPNKFKVHVIMFSNADSNVGLAWNEKYF